MATVYRGSGWKIAVYGREHGIPHYHIEGAGYRCSVGIATQVVIIGSAPADVLKAAQVWARANRAALLVQWQELNE
jgi:hypothetical protein